MKKSMIALLILFALVSCEKQIAKKVTGKVTFKFEVTENNLKSELPISYIRMKIDGEFIMTDVFYINGIPFSSPVSLTVGNHELQEFLLMNDNMTPEFTDDILVAAVPHEGSLFANLVADPLNIMFLITEFNNTEQSVEAVNYTPESFTSFGFVYYQVDELVVRELDFAGNICADTLENYTNTIYCLQTNGVQWIMPAIYTITVYRDGIYQDTFSNVDSMVGEGGYLRVQYIDPTNEENIFIFKLMVMLPQNHLGNLGSYPFGGDTWVIGDNDPIPDPNGNGYLDFCIGDCVQDADLTFPIWHIPAGQ